MHCNTVGQQFARQWLSIPVNNIASHLTDQAFHGDYVRQRVNYAAAVCSAQFGNLGSSVVKGDIGLMLRIYTVNCQYDELLAQSDCTR